MKKVNHRFLLVLMYACSVVLSSFFIFSCFIPTQEQKEAEKAEEINRTTVLSSTNDWVYGNFKKEGQIKTYTLHVTKGTRYFIYLNDSSDGDSTKTANVGMKISHDDGTVICNYYGDADNCFSKPFSFSASNNGVVTISVAAYYYGWEKGTGTYGINTTHVQNTIYLIKNSGKKTGLKTLLFQQVRQINTLFRQLKEHAILFILKM